jgi:hypothetical protein
MSREAEARDVGTRAGADFACDARRRRIAAQHRRDGSFDPRAAREAAHVGVPEHARAERLREDQAIAVREPCVHWTGSKALFAKEESVLFCSVVADCKACAGALKVDCRQRSLVWRFLQYSAAATKGAGELSSNAFKDLATKLGGKKFGAIVPFQPFVDVFQDTKAKPDGDVALCILSATFNRLAKGADPYTAELYATLAVSLKAAGGESCEFQEF